ncbi:AAA family ATPase [Deinococcus sp. VB142]|uniref:AAA family ATPase n=1 Tax=Deinococcus sp. VB142 TaxID=3112952 RepID=A0AAU6PYG1_9DEIO
MTARVENEQEIDVGSLWRGIRRRAPWILATTLLLGAGTYFWSSSRPEVYSASASLISSNSTNPSDSVLGGAIVKAPPLPEGAIAEALKSTQVIRPLMNSIQTSSVISTDEKARVLSDLNNELREQSLRTITLTSRVEQYGGGSGIYTLTAKARTPQAAAEIANLARTSLLKWDKQRALQNIKRAESGYRAQLAQIDQQLNNQKNETERQTLIARRANIASNLATVSILRDSITGVLSELSDAIAPLQPDSPKPVRDAILAGLLGFLLSAGVAALITLFDRTVRREEDLMALNLPVLAVIPRMRQRDVVMSGIVRAARQVGLYEAIGFLRVNLLTSFRNHPKPIIMVTSTAPGEGKSSITATLADGFATSGQRVLIVDTDLRRGTQEDVWQKFNEAGNWHQMIGSGGARNIRKALLQPTDVQVLQVAENIDLLPAGQAVTDSLSVFNQADIRGAFELWRQYYDIVLVDSAPLLALADGLIVGRAADGVILVTGFGETQMQAVQATLRRAQGIGLNLIGAVINKASVDEKEHYSYPYTSTSPKGAKA